MIMINEKTFMDNRDTVVSFFNDNALRDQKPLIVPTEEIEMVNFIEELRAGSPDVYARLGMSVREAAIQKEKLKPADDSPVLKGEVVKKDDYLVPAADMQKVLKITFFDKELKLPVKDEQDAQALKFLLFSIEREENNFGTGFECLVAAKGYFGPELSDNLKLIEDAMQKHRNSKIHVSKHG